MNNDKSCFSCPSHLQCNATLSQVSDEPGSTHHPNTLPLHYQNATLPLVTCHRPLTSAPLLHTLLFELRAAYVGTTTLGHLRGLYSHSTTQHLLATLPHYRHITVQCSAYSLTTSFREETDVVCACSACLCDRNRGVAERLVYAGVDW
jgi:hypothetical protein